jgi:hypothetical protein
MAETNRDQKFFEDIERALESYEEGHRMNIENISEKLTRETMQNLLVRSKEKGRTQGRLSEFLTFSKDRYSNSVWKRVIEKLSESGIKIYEHGCECKNPYPLCDCFKDVTLDWNIKKD